MVTQRVGLIGHSGAGKSSCLVALGIDRKLADMDAVLGTQQSPPLKTALDWLVAGIDAPAIVVVSNHEQMLMEMQQAKSAGLYSDRFSAFHLVYLRKSKDQLQAHLALPSTGGRSRDQASQRYTLDSYERFDVMFAQLADRTVDCSGLSVDEVAVQICELAQERHT